MTTAIKIAATAALLALTLNSVGSAADSGGVQVDGSLRSTVVVGNAVNIAKGRGAKAEISIGNFHSGTNLNGSIRQTIFVKRVVNIAKGKGSPACIKIGSYGKSPICR